MNPPGEGLGRQFGQVVDLGHGDQGEGAQVRADNQRLGVGVADDPDAQVAAEFGQVRLELGAKIAVFDAVDRAGEPLSDGKGQAAAPGAQV